MKAFEALPIFQSNWKLSSSMSKTLAGIRQNESNVIYGNTAQKTKKSLTENFIICAVQFATSLKYL